MNRHFIFIITVLVFIGCQKIDKREFYVKPIKVVCDYPFNDTTKWAITCRVWGLLKYYHPNVTSGKLDWDKVLLDRLDKINKAYTSEQVNLELMQMIRTAGTYKGTIDKKWKDSLNMNVNLCWLDNSFINETIRQELREIASLKVKQPSHYVGNTEIGSLTFDNEKDYDKTNLIIFYDYRLLAFFRYWNVIYYFFPYKYLMDQSWDTILEEFIFQFIKADDFEKYSKVILQLATKINDGHGYTTISPLADPYTRITDLIDSLTVIRNPPKQSLLEKGDIILSINGKNIGELRDSLSAIIPSSNLHYRNAMINAWINQSILNVCSLSIKRNQQSLAVNNDSKIFLIKDESKPYYLILPDIGYIDLGVLKTSEIEDMFESFENTRGIIFDLRNYPRHLNQWQFFCHLSSIQRHYYAQANLADLSHCGAFYIYNERCIMAYSDEKFNACKKYKGEKVVLINEVTMSAAETAAFSFKIHGSTLIGTPTAGANGNVAIFRMPGGIDSYFTSIGYYFPDGKQMQRIGIIPDIEVYPTMESILEGKDEILEEAIKYINNLK